MMINSANLYNTSSYSYQFASTSSTSVEGQGGPQGQQAPPPPPQGGPQVDTDGSNTWDITELEELSTSLSDQDGESFDAEEVLSTYDTNENGVIDEDEAEALAEEDAFNLSNMQSVMIENSVGSMPPPPPPGKEDEMGIKPIDEDASASATDSEDDLIASLLETFEEIEEARKAEEEKAAEEAEEEESEEDDDEELLVVTKRTIERALNAYAMQAGYLAPDVSALFDKEAV